MIGGVFTHAWFLQECQNYISDSEKCNLRFWPPKRSQAKVYRWQLWKAMETSWKPTRKVWCLGTWHIVSYLVTGCHLLILLLEVTDSISKQIGSICFDIAWYGSVAWLNQGPIGHPGWNSAEFRPIAYLVRRKQHPGGRKGGDREGDASFRSGRSSRRSKGSKWNMLCSFVDASMCERWNLHFWRFRLCITRSSRITVRPHKFFRFTELPLF